MPSNSQAYDAHRAPFAGILAGPTASGKSELAVEAARRHGLAIISADSMQVYRGMEIGTGVHPEHERHGVPHHLVSVAHPGQDFHAQRFVEEATAAARREWEENHRRSLVVGGTGMWIQALREGLFEGPGRDENIRLHLRQEMDRQGKEALHQRLAAIDPPMAESLSPRDHVRVLRALEVFELSGRTMTDWYREDQERRARLGPLIPLVVVRLPREELYRRIDQRVDKMIAAGWLDEARALLELGLPEHAPARKALGYRELFRVLESEWTLEHAREEIKKATRRFAKRQMTWFRGQRGVAWLDTPTVEDVEKALGFVYKSFQKEMPESG